MRSLQLYTEHSTTTLFQWLLSLNLYAFSFPNGKNNFVLTTSTLHSKAIISSVQSWISNTNSNSEQFWRTCIGCPNSFRNANFFVVCARCVVITGFWTNCLQGLMDFRCDNFSIRVNPFWIVSNDFVTYFKTNPNLLKRLYLYRGSKV